ncbi:hypothetical protein FACS1894110_09100 [Spirochaetia bacterium]|nr:hypothetical protein FACS1894110_09100 [Spirochaetia bacterium]
MPLAFEEIARNEGIRNFTIQGKDDIHGMMENENLGMKGLLDWTKRVIHQQFQEIIPLLQENEILVASNTEFGAASIAEYCKKPFMRTAYGPLIPGKAIYPPLFSLTAPNPIIKPGLVWSAINSGMNMMTRDILNAHRLELGMRPVKNHAHHNAAGALNYLMYSKTLGSIDPDWKYDWDIGGYIFNDDIPYDQSHLDEFLAFAKKDDKPLVFFTLGSCNSHHAVRFADYIDNACKKLHYKLAIGAGWQKVGSKLEAHEDLFLLNTTIPHCKIFPHIDAIVHHGGVGTTHSAARWGIPQMITALLMDQWYWAYRTKILGAGPGNCNIKKVNEKQLTAKLKDLVENQFYKKCAADAAQKMQAEDGLTTMCEKIETFA